MLQGTKTRYSGNENPWIRGMKTRVHASSGRGMKTRVRGVKTRALPSTTKVAFGSAFVAVGFRSPQALRQARMWELLACLRPCVAPLQNLRSA